jgi:hypothetical protein
MYGSWAKIRTLSLILPDSWVNRLGRKLLRDRART